MCCIQASPAIKPMSTDLKIRSSWAENAVTANRLSLAGRESLNGKSKLRTYEPSKGTILVVHVYIDSNFEPSKL